MLHRIFWIQGRGFDNYASVSNPTDDKVNAPLVAQLSSYAGLTPSAERAAMLARTLAPALASLRAIRPANYDSLAPAISFIVPRP